MDHFRNAEMPFHTSTLSLTDGETIEWMISKSTDFIRLMSYYRCAMMEIETKLNVLNEEYKLQHDRNPINSTKTRLKSPLSIQGKLIRKGLPLTLENIEYHLNDVAGIRVVCSFPEDVYTIADALLAQDDIVLLQRKDYIQQPKENGYRSLHLIVTVPIFLTKEKREMKVELQLRTIAMDNWASLEHQIRYKKERIFTPEMEEKLAYCAELSAELDRCMDELIKNFP